MSYFKVGLDARGRSKWRVRVQHEGRRLSRNVHGSEREAKRIERELIAELLGGAQARVQTPTVEAYLIERWLPHIALHREPGTHARYRGTIRRHVIPFSGQRPLDQVSIAELQDVLDAMLVGGRATKTVHAARGVLHKAFADAIRWGLITQNPVSGTTAEHGSSPTFRVLNQNELASVTGYAVGRPIEPILHVAAMTGARQGEVLGLKWDCGRLRPTRHPH